MYRAEQDRYCYPRSKVLINIIGVRNAALLKQFELEMTTLRFDEPLPMGRLGKRHYCAVHKHLFQDVYAWAGKLRTVRIAKGTVPFCYPENIDRELDRIFAALKASHHLRGLPRPQFAQELAHFIAELNAVHAFREGNGRTQNAFMFLVAHKAGHPMNLRKLKPRKFLAAMIASFHGDERPLRQEILGML